MPPPTITVRELERFPNGSSDDRLIFKPGVNTLVGRPNTGKTKWLRMLDFILGSEKQPADAFDDELAEKYEAARLLVTVDDEEISIERRWKDRGLKTKILVNDDPMNHGEFSHYLLDKLSIPSVQYPQGDPLGPRAWPELGWRSLFRHMYRRQNFWSDLADQQPESEQHACILQFLGLADKVFSKDYADLAENMKELTQLQARKDEFFALLQEVSREIVEEQDLTVALTPDSIKSATDRIGSELDSVSVRRNELLQSLRDSVVSEPAENRELDEATNRLAKLQAERESLMRAIQRLDERIAELQRYRESIDEEASRMERALSAGSLLASLKVTHCPACDRDLDKQVDDSKCQVCGRPMEAGRAGAERRLEFEKEQLAAERSEADELLASQRAELEGISGRLADVDRDLARVQLALRPVRQKVAAILLPDITLLDMRTGRLEERLSQLSRIEAALDRRVELAQKIDETQKRVADLEAEVEQAKRGIDMEQASDQLSDGMNTYLNALNAVRQAAWTQKEVAMRLKERDFSFSVGDVNWKTKLGGTLTIYLLLAYHYGLMRQAVREGFHFPGLVILDFPAELDDGSTMEDEENFVLEPFVSLLSESGFERCQVIAVGRSFADLEGANRITLTKVWG